MSVEKKEWLQEVASFEEAALRDLAWVLLSPPLVPSSLFPEASVLQQREELLAWLREVDADALKSYLEERTSRRLGVYTEALWSFFLHHYPAVEVLAEGLQIHRDKQTLGEFDFVIREKQTGRVVHLELAVKFYLGVLSDDSSLESWDSWIGPACKDRLDLKLNRLLEHQTQLSKLPEGRAALDALGMGEIVSEMWVGGVLFAPASTLEEADFPRPEHLSESLQQGKWARYSEFVSNLSSYSPALRWICLQRLEWLAPPSHPASPGHGALLSALDAALEQWKQPVQVMSLRWEDGQWLEDERWFVTPDDWAARSLV